MSELQAVYTDRNYCIEEMGRIREMWGYKTTFSKKAIEGARTSLGFMLLYCPEELTNSVLSMIEELGQREILTLIHNRPTPEVNP
jgi:hypothetical protein